MHIDDILNSPLRKPKTEVDVKDIGVLSNPDSFLAAPEPPKAISVKIDRTAVSQDGSKTTYTLSTEFPFHSPAELREILDSVGYFGDQSLLTRLKRSIQHFLVGIIQFLRGKKP